MRVKFLLIIFFFFSSCSSQNGYPGNERQKLVNEVRKKTAIQLHRQFNLHPCGTGAQMMHEIKMLALSFNYNQEISLEQGRELLIAAVNEFVSTVNSTERIHPYLYNYPFEPRNVEVRIFLHNADRSDLPMGKICVISAINGILEYEIEDPSTPLFKTITARPLKKVCRR